MDDENTPLLQNASASSSNINDGSNANVQQNNYSPGLSDTPMSEIDKENDTWVKNQKDYISKSGKRASFRKRLAFHCDTSSAGRFWDLIDAVLSAMFVVL